MLRILFLARAPVATFHSTSASDGASVAAMPHDNGEEDVEATALARLSVRIGMIMEDHAGEAILALPRWRAERLKRFERLRRAGSDITAMASAAEALLRS